MNWGKGVVIVLGSFIIFITILAVTLMTTDVDLESDDYYAREINYGEEMKAVQKAEDLDQKIELNSIEGYLAVQIPQQQNVQNLEVRLIRLDNDKLDRNYQITDTKTFLIDKKELVKGKYKAEIYYTIDGEKYMQKEAFYLTI